MMAHSFPTGSLLHNLSRFLLACALLFSIGVRCRLATFPLERDEGEYAYSGQLLLEGIPPYQLAYNMKLPGTYIAYALLMGVFGQTPVGVHHGLLLVNLMTIVLLYFLTRSLFDPLCAGGAALVFAILSVSYSVLGMAAHATHFVTLFGIAGTFLLWQYFLSSHRFHAFASGLLLGVAFLMKQHGIFLTLFGTVSLLTQIISGSRASRHRRLRDGAAFGIGTAMTYLLVCWWLWSAGVWDAFEFWTIDYAAEYARGRGARPPLYHVVSNILAVIGPNFSLWIMAVLGVIGSMAKLIPKTAPVTSPPVDDAAQLSDRPKLMYRVAFACGYLVFSGLCVVPGFLFRDHYFVVVLPAIAMFASIGCLSSEVWTDKSFLLIAWKRFWDTSSPPLSDIPDAAHQLPLQADASLIDFSSHAATKSSNSQSTIVLGIVLLSFAIQITVFLQRSYLFITPPIQLCRQIYGLWSPFPESEVIADYLRVHTAPSDTIAVLGSEPQLYFLSQRHSCTGYIYMYPLMEEQPFARRMQQQLIREVEEGNPKFVVDVHVSVSWQWANGESGIFDWQKRYLKDHYRCVGVCLFTRGEPVFSWGGVIEAPAASKTFIAVYQRN